MQKKTIRKVLVVDDDPILAKLVKEVLEKHNYNVQHTKEAPDGLQIALKNPPDLIILDVMMPIINGFNFCKLLKSEDGHPHIPIILVTARNNEEDIRIGMEMGADAVLINTAVATAEYPAASARAFSLAIQAGRLAYLSTPPMPLNSASASSPLTGFLYETKRIQEDTSSIKITSK